MDPRSIQLEIRLLMSSIRVFIKQIPSYKQQKAVMKVQQTANKLPQMNTSVQLQKMLQDLQFQANFLKLSNPDLEFKQTAEDISTESEFIPQIDILFDEKETQQNPIKGPGTYVMKDGRLVEGRAEKKVEVDYSNWHAGNVDPQDLKRLRHKELLDRQHFRGPFWDGKPMPKSVLEDSNPFKQGFQDSPPPQGQINPTLVNDKQQTWETVKR